MKRKLRSPFFVINPKSYLYGNKIITFAKECDKLSLKYDIDTIFTGPFSDLYCLAHETKNLIISAQHMDGYEPGPGMGKILPHSLKEAGVSATFLNHAEHPMALDNIISAMKHADEMDILTIVCANAIREAQSIAFLKPDIMVCEPTSLIGTGKTSDLSYKEKTNQAIHDIDPDIYILQAAGISTTADVKEALNSGADGTGGTSGIVSSENPVETVDQMLQTIAKWRDNSK